MVTILDRPAYAFGLIAALVVVVAGGDRDLDLGRRQPTAGAVEVRDGRRRDAAGARRARLGDVDEDELGLAGRALGDRPAASPDGRYYQAWLKNSAGVLVPIGTFNDAVNVTLWSGVPVTQFRTLTVTRQQANGNPASSGRRVLIGTIRSSG